jgi:hypothetical protein
LSRLAMTEAERFRKEAEECLRHAERAVSPLAYAARDV